MAEFLRIAWPWGPSTSFWSESTFRSAFSTLRNLGINAVCIYRHFEDYKSSASATDWYDMMYRVAAEMGIKIIQYTGVHRLNYKGAKTGEPFITRYSRSPACAGFLYGDEPNYMGWGHDDCKWAVQEAHRQGASPTNNPMFAVFGYDLSVNYSKTYTPGCEIFDIGCADCYPTALAGGGWKSFLQHWVDVTYHRPNNDGFGDCGKGMIAVIQAHAEAGGKWPNMMPDLVGQYQVWKAKYGGQLKGIGLWLPHISTNKGGFLDSGTFGDKLRTQIKELSRLTGWTGAAPPSPPLVPEYPTHVPPTVAWLRPTSHTPTARWSDEVKAYDGSTAGGSHAVCLAADANNYLELSLAAIRCDKVRIWATDYRNIDPPGHQNPNVAIDVYYSGGWHNIHSGVITQRAWVEKAIGSTQLVTAARVKFNAIARTHGLVYELQFNNLTLLEPTPERKYRAEPPKKVWNQYTCPNGDVVEITNYDYLGCYEPKIGQIICPSIAAPTMQKCPVDGLPVAEGYDIRLIQEARPAEPEPEPYEPPYEPPPPPPDKEPYEPLITEPEIVGAPAWHEIICPRCTSVLKYKTQAINPKYFKYLNCPVCEKELGIKGLEIQTVIAKPWPLPTEPIKEPTIVPIGDTQKRTLEILESLGWRPPSVPTPKPALAEPTFGEAIVSVDWWKENWPWFGVVGLGLTTIAILAKGGK